MEKVISCRKCYSSCTRIKSKACSGKLQISCAARLINAKLKAVCSSFLLENLTSTKAGERLASADTRSDSDLKKSVEDFILEHEEEVFGSKEWELLMEKILG
ncbi:hypothetical protein AVEN_212658-1 [Araneus ventricosus]|uniref:Uncharacterized protein n=1 Tax=Araneus ventricosus TaxID=182803 RepID=A0A4Y2R5R9_ARAVE|nr:hypothetical protein AVEN_232938-1 [Araneus ventricosus]GBN71013.1 hypothetical protein AVEN_212658-1 [Araneus ventricosus]